MKRHRRPERREGHHVQMARELYFKETGEWLETAPREFLVRAARMQVRAVDFGLEELELATFIIEHSATMARAL